MSGIVSLLPAATEIVHALGAGDQLVGRSHECDYPAGVQTLPIVSRPALDLAGLDLKSIDDAVASRMHSGESLYMVDEALLESLAPDLILTQDLCQVCAPSGNELSRALSSLPGRPEVMYLTPRTLGEIDENILAVGAALGRDARAREVVEANHAEIERIRERASRVGKRCRVSFLEWTDPPFCAGHWVPEMIEIAGGYDQLGRSGEDSVRVTWNDIVATRPDVVIVAPCGFGLTEATRLATTIPAIPQARVVPVDANAYFARPGPRYARGVEELAKAFHPDW